MSQWLRVGAVGLGLGAAVTAGQGTAAAAPDDTSHSSAHANRSGQGEHHGEKTSRPSGTSHPVRLSSPAVPAPTALLKAASQSNSVAAVSVRTATKPSRAAFGNVVGDALAALSGAVREVELSVSRRETVSPSASTPLGIGQSRRAAVEHLAVNNAASAALTEDEQEAADARFNMTSGWVPVLGTVYNALSFTTDFLQFASALARADGPDIFDEIADMATDVVGIVPIVGGPLAAVIYHLRVGSSTPAGMHAGTPPYTVTTIDTSTGVVSGTVNVTGTNGAELSYEIVADVDPVVGEVSVNSSSGAFVFSPTQATRYEAAVTAGDDTIPFTVSVSDGKTVVKIIVKAPISSLHPDDDGVLDLADLDTLAALGAIGVSEDADGTITAIVGSFTDNRVTNASEALEELNHLAGALGANGSLSGNIVTQTAGLGGANEVFYRLTHTVDGIPVLGGDVILSTLADGTPTGVFNGINPAAYSVNTSPYWNLDSAGEVISAASGILLGSMQNAPTGDQLTAFLAGLTFDQKLVVYALDPDAAPALAWSVDIHTTDPEAVTDLPVVSTTYYIYANGTDAGSLLAQHSGLSYAATPSTVQATGLLRKTFTINISQDGSYLLLVDTLRGPGISVHATPFLGNVADISTWRIGPNPFNIIGKSSGDWDPAAVSAIGNLEIVYDYYKNVLHVPQSLLDTIGTTGASGQPRIEVGVISDADLRNAFWDGDPGRGYFAFSSGYEAARDVVGHEFTHAVIQAILGRSDGIGANTPAKANSDANALDEAYGDIIGSLIEGKDGDDRWKLGEDTPTGSDRDMRVIKSGTDAHDRATIFDRAAYLMMNDSRTAGVPKETWARIFYGSLYRLQLEATFQDARNAVIASASVAGLNPNAQKAIADAFNDVGISTTPRVKIVLTWGSTPSDLDSHLTGPSSVTGGSRFHVYYSQRDYFKNGTYTSGSSASQNNRLSVDLDYDDTSSYGPESTTIRNLVAGDYYFYVHDYSDRNSSSSEALGDSGATVTVYMPGQSDDQNILSYLFGSIFGANPTVFHVDTSSDGTLWTVFKLTISASDPNHPTIMAINQYSYQSTPSNVGQYDLPQF